MQIASWEDVDQALRRIGELRATIERIEGETTVRINQVKDEGKQAAIGYVDEAKALEKAVEDYCDKNKDRFAKKRSLELNFGTVAYRLVHRVPLPRVKDRLAALVKALKAYGQHQCVCVEERLDRDQIEALDDATLAKLGLQRITADKFRLEPDMARITGELRN